MGEVAATTAAGAGKTIGEYDLVARLGKGGMGSVFRAKHRRTGEVVAFKVLMPSDAKNARLVKRFQRESKIARGLEHENIVAGLDAGMVGNLCYLAMEYVEGESLAELLQREKRLGFERSLKIMYAVARGLAYAHAKGLIHRDVKPENVLLGRDGSIKLCDLGLAREVADTGFTMLGAALGTPKYMSPEQVAGVKTIDARTDVYSLGATAYHMVSGRTPFEGASSALVMAAQVAGTFTPLRDVAPDVDPRISAVIEKCMQKDPNGRYQGMAELAADLKLIASGRPPEKAYRIGARAAREGGRPAGPAASKAKGAARKGRAALLAAIVVVVLGLIGAAAWSLVWGPLSEIGRRLLH